MPEQAPIITQPLIIALKPDFKRELFPTAFHDQLSPHQEGALMKACDEVKANESAGAL